MRYLIDIRDKILIREKEPLDLEVYSYSDKVWVYKDWLVGVYDGDMTCITVSEKDDNDIISGKNTCEEIIKKYR